MSTSPQSRRLRIRELPGPGSSRLGIAVRTRHDIGAVLLQPESAEKIAGVEIEAGAVWPDDRGYFSELFRLEGGIPETAGITRGFSPTAQISAALSFPDTIKAFHYHRFQTDLWAPVRGSLQMVLYDLRVDSASFGQVNTVYAGEWRPWRMRIPPGVAHGYKVVGTEAALMVYATDRFYDPTDEGRIPYNDPDVNYDWERQHK